MSSSSITQPSENTARSVLKAFLVRPVAFHPVLARVCGSVHAGLMLGQALYWNDRTDETGWFYKTVDQWGEEICLSRYEQESARKKLRDLGLLEEKFMASPPKLYFRVNLDAISDAVFRFIENEQSNSGKTSKLNLRKTDELNLRETSGPTRGKLASQLGENQQVNSGKTSEFSLLGSETTAETTTEITAETTTSKALPPYPPASGEGEVQSRQPEQETSFWQLILAELKAAIYTASLNTNLPNEYDKYFRDSWQLDIVDGELVLGAENPELLREGLKKYERRIRELFGRMLGIEPTMRVLDRPVEVQL